MWLMLFFLYYHYFLITDKQMVNAKCNTSLSTALNGNTRPQGVDVDLLQKAQRLLKSGLLSYSMLSYFALGDDA